MVLQAGVSVSVERLERGMIPLGVRLRPYGCASKTVGSLQHAVLRRDGSNPGA